MTPLQHLEIMMRDLDSLRQEVHDQSILAEIDRRSGELLYQYLKTK